MNKLILVRYGEHEDGHLSEQGKKTMILAADKIKSFIQNQNAYIIAAKVDRAVESAKMISKNLNLPFTQQFSELYAAEEEGIAVNLEVATRAINYVGQNCDILIAVVSREYIESLPNYILQSLGVEKPIETHLERGEILILDYGKKEITYA